MNKIFNKLVNIEMGNRKFIVSIIEKFRNNNNGVPITKMPTPATDCIITSEVIKINIINSSIITKQIYNFVLI